LNLILFLGIGLPSYSSNLKLEINASTLENSGLNHIKVDYQTGSATDIKLEPFTYGWIPAAAGTCSGVAFEPENTLHFCIDESGNEYQNDPVFLKLEEANDFTLDQNPQSRTRYLNMTEKKYKTDNRYFRFCIVNEKNKGYIVSNLYSFRLNSDHEINEAKTITWSEMPEKAQKAMGTLINKKAIELKESFTPEMIKNQINQWK